MIYRVALAKDVGLACGRVTTSSNAVIYHQEELVIGRVKSLPVPINIDCTTPIHLAACNNSDLQ